jgi:uncharacterized protein YdeI (YjbR/CyaY-like superfamily)
MKITKTFYAGSRAEWREWLVHNHSTQDEVWLIFFKRQNAKKQVSYDEAVAEALCFGWIDSIIQKIDDEKYVRKFTPRKKSSRWSALNKRRVARMIQEGKMTEAGLAVLNFTDEKDDYGRTAERAEQRLIPPPFLVRRLKQNKQAWDNFQLLAPSYRRNYIGWICAAKTEETRDRRIKEAIGKLAKNEKLGMK